MSDDDSKVTRGESAKSLFLRAKKTVKKISGGASAIEEKEFVTGRKRQVDSMATLYHKVDKSSRSYLEERRKSAQKGALMANAFEEASKSDPNPGLRQMFDDFLQMQSKVEFLHNACAEELLKDFVPRFLSLEGGLADVQSKRKKYNDSFLRLESEHAKGEKASQTLIAELGLKCDSSAEAFDSAAEHAVARHEQECAAAIATFIKHQQHYYKKASEILNGFRIPDIQSTAAQGGVGSREKSDYMKFGDDEDDENDDDMINTSDFTQPEDHTDHNSDGATDDDVPAAAQGGDFEAAMESVTLED